MTLRSPFSKMGYALSLLILTACGGGGSSDSNSPEQIETPVATNRAPVLSVSNVEANESTTLTISADATDSDGSITNYQWIQKSGTSVTIENSNTSSITFETPAVTATEELVFTVTATDNDGAATSQDITVTILNLSESFTLIGKAQSLGTPLANHQVEIIVGEQNFTGTTNEIGNYQIEITGVQDSNLSSLIQIVVRGRSINSILKLASYLDTAENLSAQAKQFGKTLTVDQIPNLQVSIYSTAGAALLEQANNEQPLTTLEQFANLSHQVDEEALVSYASMLHELLLRIDDPDRLPEQISDGTTENIYQLLAKKEFAQQTYDFFANDYQLMSYSSFVDYTLEHRSKLTSNAFVTQDDNIYWSGMQANFLSDSTGSSAFGSYSWQQDGNSIRITLDNVNPEGEQIFQQVRGINGVNLYPDYYRFERGFVLSPLFDSPSKDIWLVETLYEYRSQNDLLSAVVVPDSENDTYEVRDIFQDSNKKELSQLASLGNKLALAFEHPIRDKIISRTSDFTEDVFNRNLIVSFDSNTQATMALKSLDQTGLTFEESTHQVNWEINDNTLRLTSDVWDISVSYFGNNSNAYDAAITSTYSTSQSSNTTFAIGKMYLNSSATPTISESDIPGIYAYQRPFYEIDVLEKSWYELRDDGTVSYFFTDRDTLEESNLRILESPGLWRIIDNKVVIRRYRIPIHLRASSSLPQDRFGRCHSSEWDTNVDDECLLYLERVWTWFSVDNNSSNLVTSHEAITFDDYLYSPEDRERLNLGDGFYILFASTFFTNWRIGAERPIALPENYVLIKDR